MEKGEGGSDRTQLRVTEDLSKRLSIQVGKITHEASDDLRHGSGACGLRVELHHYPGRAKASQSGSTSVDRRTGSFPLRYYSRR